MTSHSARGEISWDSKGPVLSKVAASRGLVTMEMSLPTGGLSISKSNLPLQKSQLLYLYGVHISVLLL